MADVLKTAHPPLRPTANRRVGYVAPAAPRVDKVADGLGPLARVFIVIIGAAIGYMLIPDDAQPEGAMRNSALAFSFGLLLVPAVEALMFGIKPALKIRNILLVGIVYWLFADLIQALYPNEATPQGIRIAYLATALFAVAVSLGGSVRLIGLPRGVRRLAQLELTDRMLFASAIFCFVAGVFYYLFMASFDPSLIITALFDRARFSAPWTRDTLGNADSFIEQLTYFGYLLPPFTAILYMRSRSFLNAKTVLCATMTAIFLLFLAQGGGRTSIGAVFGSAILVGTLLTRRRVKGFQIVTILAATFAVQVAMNYMLENRGNGLGAAKVEDWTFSRVRVDDNFNRLSQTADFVPTFYPYSNLQFFYYTLVRPIPRVLWPGKPVDPGFELATVLNDEDTSYTISVIGEAYAGFGFPLVFVMGLLFGALARWWEQTLDDRPTSVAVMIYSIGAMALFGAERGFVNIVVLSYPILSLWAAFALFRLGQSRVVLGRSSA
jgi:hypothetical protein